MVSRPARPTVPASVCVCVRVCRPASCSMVFLSQKCDRNNLWDGCTADVLYATSSNRLKSQTVQQITHSTTCQMHKRTHRLPHNITASHIRHSISICRHYQLTTTVSASRRVRCAVRPNRSKHAQPPTAGDRKTNLRKKKKNGEKIVLTFHELTRHRWYRCSRRQLIDAWFVQLIDVESVSFSFGGGGEGRGGGNNLIKYTKIIGGRKLR